MNFFKNSSFDYHLQPNEQNQIERLVPYNQAKIHLAFRANISYSDLNSTSKKDYNNAAVALSEHMVTICVHGFFGRSYKLFTTFHVNDITELQSKSDELTVIKTIKGVYCINSQASLRFARNVVRNYILSNPMMPPALRFQFKATDPSKFPKFDPQLSPSQQFQFTYNSSCSYFDVTYYHDIPRYYHDLVNTGSCIFDFTQLPIHLMECGLGQSSDIRPVTSALMFDSFIYGINISDITRDDIIAASAPIILMSPTLRIIRMIKTGAQKSGMMISNAMNQSRNQGVVYWDFSDNQLEDIVYFVDSLNRYKGQLITLRLNHCKMTNSDVTTLLTSLIENENNHHIKQLALIDNGFNQTNCEEFCDFLNEITSSQNENEDEQRVSDNESDKELADIENENDDPTTQLIQKGKSKDTSLSHNLKVSECFLYHLELGPVKNPSIIIQTINDRFIPLKTLKIVDSSFDENCSRSFANFLNTTTTLRELDISGSSLKDQQLQIILDSLLTNSSIEDGSLALCLNRLNLKGNRYSSIKNILIEHQSKIVELSLNENGLTMNDSVISDIGLFENLKKVSLAVNFHKKMTGIGESLSSILNHSNITSINISGNSTTGQFVSGYALENEAIPFIRHLYTNNSLEELDISGNLIGDVGIKMINEILRENNKLKVINIDNNGIKNIETINDFLDSVSESKSIINAVFPVDDVYDLLSDELSTMTKNVETISLKRQIAQKVTMNNRSKSGFYSSLSLLNDKTLDDIVDEATLELQEKIEIDNVQFEKHAVITEIVGLPLPYEDENATDTIVSLGGNDEDDDENGDDVYTSKQMMSTVFEPENESNIQLTSFKTLQFNSLCIRRPDAEQKLEEKGKFLLQDVDMTKLIHPQEFNESLNNDDGNKKDLPDPSTLDI